MASQVGLQISHEQRRTETLSRHVPDDEAQAPIPTIEEIKIVSTDLPRLQADACVVQRSHDRALTGEEPRLHLRGNLQLVSGAAVASARSARARCSASSVVVIESTSLNKNALSSGSRKVDTRTSAATWRG